MWTRRFYEDEQEVVELFTDQNKYIGAMRSGDEQFADLVELIPELLEQLEIVLGELLIAWDKNQEFVSSAQINREIEIHKATLAVIAKAKGAIDA